MTNLNFPNGIIRSQDGLIYVVHLIKRKIEVYRLLADGALEHIDSIDTPYPVDNLSIDSEGDIYAAAFPKAYTIFDVYDGKPVHPPTSVFKISRKEKSRKGSLKQKDAKTYTKGYVVEKVLEDNGSLLPASTKAIHDPKTGSIFLSGIVSRFIAVCKPR